MDSSRDEAEDRGVSSKLLDAHKDAHSAEPVPDLSPVIQESRHRRQRFAALVALLIARCLPERRWYRCVLFLMDMQVRFGGASNARKLDHIDPWMERLTYLGRPFSIPSEVSGLDALPPIGSRENGVLYCSGHIPMVRIGLRALIQHGHFPTAAIAESSAFATHSEVVLVWGMKEQIPGIATGLYSLVKARSILRNGGSVALLTDRVAGDRHSPNAFELARRLGTRIVFFFTEVRQDGSILVTFKTPPYPVCTSDESIQRNIASLENELNQIAARAV